MYFWPCWVSIACAGCLCLRWAGATLHCSGWASHCGGLASCGAQALGTQASVVGAPEPYSSGSVAAADGLSCSMARGIVLEQESNPHRLHWQVNSYPLCHQRSPGSIRFHPTVLFCFLKCRVSQHQFKWDFDLVTHQGLDKISIE